MAKVVFKSYNQNDNLLFPPCLGDFIAENGWGDKLRKPEDLARILRAFAVRAYSTFEDDLKLEVVTGAIHADFESAVPEEAVIRFDRDGWDMAI